jgi:hypothetical protein
MQTASKDAPKRSMVGTFVHVAKNDGVLGLYRGVCDILVVQDISS